MSEPRDAVPIKQGLWSDEPGVGMRLLGNRCTACGELFFPRRNGGRCTQCQAEALEPVALGPLGRIESFTAVLQPPAGGFYHGPVPYCYGLVDLDEGLRVVSRLAGDYADLRRGMRVRLVTEDLSVDEQGRRVQAFSFAPANEAGAPA